MPGSGDLFAAMQEFFDVCLAALADTPAGAPECAYICETPPAWDTCPCLIVYCGGPTIADTFPLQPSLAPGHRVAITGEVNLVTLTATILRCVPSLDESGALPTPAEHAASALQTSSDLWAIWNHLRAAKAAETLFAPKTREWFFDPAVALNSAGGCGGWQITIRTELGGYRPS